MKIVTTLARNGYLRKSVDLLLGGFRPPNLAFGAIGLDKSRQKRRTKTSTALILNNTMRVSATEFVGSFLAIAIFFYFCCFVFVVRLRKLAFGVRGVEKSRKNVARKPRRR